ncbi:glycosyltransferase family 39 protein [Sphingomonas sp. UNC305MFCol5.2]|uniref:glycosyltransferase family 39 protein n=1 Tax=Sphingomonas sp. UNC305MFCol5.2 TaxID=1449076 RepID=UPI00068D7213|nr:glycosyltransferase family 39 protein [Sphingomonas sp. UNC305MFCol5.2]
MAGNSAVAVRAARLPSLAAVLEAFPNWSILLLAAIAVRAIAFGNPVVHVDEEFYFYTAQRILDGALPYVDIWDRKPIGLFLIYLPAAAFGPVAGLWIYQAMALASVVLTALVIVRLAGHAGWGRGGLVAALLYLFMLGFGDGQSGQAPVFYNLITASAMLLALPCTASADSERLRKGKAVVAMALIGVAMQVKYSVLFEGMFLGLWLLWRERRLGCPTHRTARFGAALVAVAMVPTLLAWGTYAAIGHGNAWFYANLGSIFDRNSDPPLVLLGAFLKVALILAPLLIVSGLSRHVPVNHESEHPIRALYFGWLIASVFGLIVFGTWFNHYALPVMLPACLCCAGFLGSHPTGRRIVAPLLLLAAGLGGEYTVWSASWHRGNATQLETLAETIGHGPGCMYVYSGNTSLYSHTGRCTLSPWVYPSHLSRERENGAVGVDQLAEIGRIFAKRPEVVVMGPAFSGERAESRALTITRLREGKYALRGRYPLGKSLLEVYAAPGSTAGVAPPRLAARSPS